MQQRRKWSNIVNPLSPYINDQILLSYPQTFLIKQLGRSHYASVNFNNAHPPPPADPRELGIFESKLANAPPQ